LKLSFLASQQIEQDLEAELDQRIKDTPIRVYIDGKEVDIDSEERDGGEVRLFLTSPLYLSDSGELLKVIGREGK